MKSENRMPESGDQTALLELARGFRAVITGVERASWTPGRLGSAGQLLWNDDGSWRPDHLARVRLVLRSALRRYRAEGTTWSLHDGVTTDRLADAIGRYWGVDCYPHSAPQSVAFARELPADAPQPTQNAAGRRLREWAVRVADAAPLPELISELDLWDPPPREIHVPADPTVRDGRPPLWSLRHSASWPPSDGAGTEREWLIEVVAELLDDDDRLVATASLTSREHQLLQILRRRVFDLHAAYLDGGFGIETNLQFLHLRHNVARLWFVEDLVDLRGIEAVADAETTASHNAKRSQAAISALMFYQAVHEWDQRAMDAIMANRFGVHTAYSDDPIERFSRRVIESAAKRRHPLGSGVKETHLPDYVRLTRCPEARRIFDFAMKMRQAPGAGTLAEYIRLRQVLDWDALDPRGKRTVLLADHSAHLDAVNQKNAGALGEIDQLMKQSLDARVEYEAFIQRDHAMAVGKSGTLRALENSLGQAAAGVAKVARLARSHETFDVRAQLETEQQLDLAIAGSTVKLGEHMMTEPSGRIDAAGASRHAAASLRWSAATLSLLEELERAGMLGAKRYEDGYLSQGAWHVQTHIIRLRCLCAAYTLSQAHGVRGARTLTTIEAIEAEYVQLVTLQEITAAQVPQILQLALWQSFLTGRLPLPARSLSTQLRRSDYITDDVVGDPSGGIPHVHVDDRRRRLITLWLLDRSWDAGAVEKVARENPAWALLQKRSGGEFGRWRAWLADRREKLRDEKTASSA